MDRAAESEPGPGEIRVRVGACGVCGFCKMQQEYLCDAPQFAGYTRNGGFATAVVADARFACPLAEPVGTDPDAADSDVAPAPLLCAGRFEGAAVLVP